MGELLMLCGLLLVLGVGVWVTDWLWPKVQRWRQQHECPDWAKEGGMRTW